MLFWAGFRVFKTAWNSVKNRASDMNLLIAICMLASYTFSALATSTPGLFTSYGAEPHVYYQTASPIITLILTGRLLEARPTNPTPYAIHPLLLL